MYMRVFWNNFCSVCVSVHLCSLVHFLLFQLYYFVSFYTQLRLILFIYWQWSSPLLFDKMLIITQTTISNRNSNRCRDRDRGCDSDHDSGRGRDSDCGRDSDRDRKSLPSIIIRLRLIICETLSQLRYIFILPLVKLNFEINCLDLASSLSLADSVRTLYMATVTVTVTVTVHIYFTTCQTKFWDKLLGSSL